MVNGKSTTLEKTRHPWHGHALFVCQRAGAATEEGSEKHGRTVLTAVQHVIYEYVVETSVSREATRSDRENPQLRAKV